MENYTIINKNIYKQLTDDELLIYCFATLETRRNITFTFSKKMLFHYLNADTRTRKLKIKSGLDSLVARSFIIKVSDDVYMVQETKVDGYYFVVYRNEFEALKEKSKLLNYFCFLVSCFNNKTHQFTMSNSFIRRGYKEKKDSEKSISNKTVIKYNKILESLDLIEIIRGKKKDKDCNEINIIKRVTVPENNNNSISDKEKTVVINDSSSEKANNTDNKSTKPKDNDNFDKTELQKEMAKILGVNESDFVIYNKQFDKIKKIGQENFIDIFDDKCSSYSNILDKQTMEYKERVSMVINCILKNDIKSGLEAIRRRKEEEKDKYFVKHKTESNICMDKRGLNDTINSNKLNYNKVIGELEDLDMNITNEIRDYIKLYIEEENKRKEDEIRMQEYGSTYEIGILCDGFPIRG